MPKQTEGKQDHHADAAAALSTSTPVGHRLHLLAAQMTDDVLPLPAALEAIRVNGGER